MAGYRFSHEPKAVPTISTRYRTIRTPIPVPESLPLLEEVYRIESRSMHGQMPIVWDRAEGFQVHDSWGNTWIDFSSTIFVANAGHGNARIVSAIRKTLDKPLLHTYTFASRERLEFLRYLVSQTPPYLEKAFLLSAGTEATEAALKLMRLHGQRIGKNNGGILCFEGNWHGRTLGAQMMGWDPAQKEWIGYLDPHIHHLPFPYPWRPEAIADPRQYFRNSLEVMMETKELNPAQDLCGIMLETFQGWGAIFYPSEFVQEIVRFAKENDLLVAFDEMQAGFGRTGELFGYMHYGVQPDLLCCGKGASSSLPMAIVLGKEDVMDLPEIGSMSSTHSANPVTCAAAKANLEALVEDGLIANSSKLGKVLHERLRLIQNRFPQHLAWVQGIGLLAGLIFEDPDGNPLTDICNQISELCLQRGLLVVHTGRESIKLAPPLCIHEDAMLEGLEILEEAIFEVVEKQ